MTPVFKARRVVLPKLRCQALELSLNQDLVFQTLLPLSERHPDLREVVMMMPDPAEAVEAALSGAGEMITVAAFGFLTALLLPLLAPVVSTLVTFVIMGGALAVNYYLWTFQLHVLPLVLTVSAPTETRSFRSRTKISRIICRSCSVLLPKCVSSPLLNSGQPRTLLPVTSITFLK